MVQKYYAAQPIALTLSDKKGTLQYTEILWNIMRMLLMGEEQMDAESALEALDKMPKEEFNNLKEAAAEEYADQAFQDYLERIHLYPETPNAPQLKPVESLLYAENEKVSEQETHNRLMEKLDEMTWGMFLLQEVVSSDGMD